jgi:hypothetical protein
MDPHSATRLVDAATSRAPASLGPRRTVSTHEFYRYPARFTPELARALINSFTEPGDLVLDPFVGGGTTLVECRLAGRVAVGNDLNHLATFVARVKTTLHSDAVLQGVSSWAAEVPDLLTLQLPPARSDEWVAAGYLRNVDGPDLWRLRKYISLARARTDLMRTRPKRDLIRCALLRTAQWAIDMRDAVPSVPEFRDAFRSNLLGMSEAAKEYARCARQADRRFETRHPRRTVILTGRAQDMANSDRVATYGAPRLVLTSPPYPGVYVNYHRWKLYGRRETPAPYWIAKQLDGKGLAHYTMQARSQKHLEGYFSELKTAFTAISSLCDERTTIAQVVGFNDANDQLPRYLDAMKAAGLREVLHRSCSTARDGRLWREVPGRRWWTHENAASTAKEVVLFHRVRS